MSFDEFTISLLVSGARPNDARLQDAHLAHLAHLHKSGVLLAGGPLSDPAGELRGLSILNVPPDEARRLKEEDEAVRAGVFSVRVMPWMIPAGAVSFTPTFFPRSMKDVTG
ncbi:hypothetical protein ISU10_16975 [Nocardioides agariphilus]|uniref:YCII-related domain-containing protein n=1 Tax=Nocardioides agariphilus TaxID=433664 RepID=A0A930VL08_9ACTN|nr:YciI family protein [Nocardioides agariphilus]MBF4769464.1 hypothetical protein [Nocardioides agariphilus]